MNVSLPEGKTAEDVVEFVIQHALTAGATDQRIEQSLTETFHLSAEEAALVRDRVFGGIVRAATGRTANRPTSIKDPFAYWSFERATREPSIIAKIYPEYADQAERLAKKRYIPAAYSRPPAEASDRPRWQFWKQS